MAPFTTGETANLAANPAAAPSTVPAGPPAAVPAAAPAPAAALAEAVALAEAAPAKAEAAPMPLSIPPSRLSEALGPTDKLHLLAYHNTLRICIDFAHTLRYNRIEVISMASVNMSIRTDSELKAQAESILSQLGMSMNGTINMFLQQIVRDKAVPLSLSLSSEQALYADLLYAQADRAKGYVGRTGDEVLADMDRIIAEVEGETV